MTGKVLITGGLGYVGGRLAQALSEEPGLQLRLGLRRPPSQPPSWFNRIETVPLDLLASDSFAPACQGVQQVIHLAALNEIDSAAEPEKALLVNGVGTLRLLRSAQRAEVQRFIYFSTAHVYGALEGRITESSLPRPMHPYAITHRVAEDFVLAARQQGWLEGMVLRLSNGFGVPALAEVNRWTLVVNDLCRQAATTGKLVLRSPGLQWRDFITLTDVVRAVRHCQKIDGAAAGDGLFNLGGDGSLRIVDMARRIAARSTLVLGFTPVIQRPESVAVEDSPPLHYCIDKLKATGFEVLGNMDEEIDATLRYCRDVFGTGR